MHEDLGFEKARYYVGRVPVMRDTKLNTFSLQAFLFVLFRCDSSSKALHFCVGTVV